MNYPIQIFSLGPKIIELHWPKIIAEDVLLEIIALKNNIENKYSPIISSIYHSYQVLSIQLKEIEYASEVTTWLKELIIRPMSRENLPARWIWTVPVCYAPEIVSTRIHVPGRFT